MTDIRAVLDETDARFIARRLHAVQVARLDGDLGANEQTALHERLRRLEPAGLKRWEANDLVTKPMERLAIIATKRRPLREHLEALFFHARTVDAAFLRLILERSSAVGRIEAADKTDTHPVGTGFLIGRGLVMTCAHVLSSALKRGNGVQLRLCGASEERCLLLAPVVAIPSLDCAVLSVYADELVPTGLPLSARRPEVDGVLVGDHVTIIHHPRGGPLRFTIRDNDVVDVLPDHIHYVAETNPGSSGAPVLNDEGNVIGLHHSAVPVRSARSVDHFLALDDSLWSPEMGLETLKCRANEAVRIDRLLSALRDELPKVADRGPRERIANVVAC